MTRRIIEIHDTLISGIFLRPGGTLRFEIESLSTFTMSASGRAENEAQRQAIIHCTGASDLQFNGAEQAEWFVYSGGLLLADGTAVDDLDQLLAGIPATQINFVFSGGWKLSLKTRTVRLELL